MDAAAIKELVPFGIVGLAIVAFVAIALAPLNSTNKILAFAAMAAIAGLAVFDRLAPMPTLRAVAAEPSDNDVEASWVAVGVATDWAGRDVAYSSGNTPRYRVKDVELCGGGMLGVVAVCWENRPGGYPVDALITDVVGTPKTWCTYKSNAISLATPPDGLAPAGRVFVCGQVVDR